MDWSKAKSILIIVFLGLNVFLAVSIITTYSGYGVSKKNIVNTIRILENRGYVFNCDMPVTTKSYKVNYSGFNFDRARIAKRLVGNAIETQGGKYENGSAKLSFWGDSIIQFANDTPKENIDISNSIKVEKYLRSLMSDMGLQSTKYFLDRYINNDDGSVNAVFREKYDKAIIINSNMSVVITKNGIKSIQCRVVNVKAFTAPVKIVSAYHILLTNFIGNDKGQIDSIELGYMCGGPLQDAKEYSEENPVWRVCIKDRPTRYFTAIDGSETTN